MTWPNEKVQLLLQQRAGYEIINDAGINSLGMLYRLS